MIHIFTSNCLVILARIKAQKSDAEHMYEDVTSVFQDHPFPKFNKAVSDKCDYTMTANPVYASKNEKLVVRMSCRCF